MASANPICEAMIHLGFGKIKNGLYEDAIETFSAVHYLDSQDDRALQGWDLAYSQLSQSSEKKYPSLIPPDKA